MKQKKEVKHMINEKDGNCEDCYPRLKHTPADTTMEAVAISDVLKKVWGKNNPLVEKAFRAVNNYDQDQADLHGYLNTINKQDEEIKMLKNSHKALLKVAKRLATVIDPSIVGGAVLQEWHALKEVITQTKGE